MMAIRRNKGWTPPGNRSNQHIARWNGFLYPRSAAFGKVLDHALENKTQTAETRIITNNYGVGDVVVLRKKVHYRMSGQDYGRGVIRAYHFNKTTAMYTIECANGETMTDIAEWRVHTAKQFQALPAPPERGNTSLPETPGIIYLPARLEQPPQDAAGEQAA